MIGTPCYSDPKALRLACREGVWKKSTSGQCSGYAQANLAILPRDLAFDFLLFCHRNPRPCSLLEVTDPGDPILKEIAPGADVRTDLPAYRVFRNGELVEERTDLLDLWSDDLVGFLIGCSYTFDAVLEKLGFSQIHRSEGREPGVYVSNIPCKPAGPFKGPMIVSVRPFRGDQVPEVVALTSKFRKTHGGPVYVGDPGGLGIDLERPESEYGGYPVHLETGQVPLFWACGVTPQIVAKASRVALMITHKPGHMFVSDLTVDEVIKD